MFLKALKGYDYTIVVYFYVFRLAFSTISHCVLHHFASRLVAKRIAFSGILQCILHQNALHFGAKCSKLAANNPKVGAKDGMFK